MYTAHKVRLYPNKQRTLLEKSCGVSRFAYNLALATWKEQYEAGEKPGESKIRKQLNARKAAEFPWMLEVSKCCPQLAIMNLGQAFNRFFKGLAGYPRFHSKHGKHCFQLDNISFRWRGDKKISLAKIGEIRMAEKFRFKDAKVMNLTVSKEADRWFISIGCEIEELPISKKVDSVVGIDVGVREYVDSSGVRYEVPRIYRKRERKLRRLQQSFSRKQKDSNNRKKARVKVAKQHLKIKNIRQDWLHKLTTNLVRNNSVIAIEDLNVKGMVKNKHLSKSLHDACFAEFRRQIEYKSQRYGRLVVIVPRFFPSSKLCSRCNTKTKVMPLSVRSWTCKNCGEHHDRDVNAAINLKNYAASLVVPACGEFSASGDPTYSRKAKQPQRSRNLTENFET